MTPIASTPQHCTCPCTCGKAKTISDASTSLLYQGPLRKPLLISLILIAVFNLAQLILAGVAAEVCVTFAFAWASYDKDTVTRVDQV